MARFIVIAGPLEHDGKRTTEGAEVALSSEAAEPLLVMGVIAAKGSAPVAAQTQQQPQE